MLCEPLLNTVVHRSYSNSSGIQTFGQGEGVNRLYQSIMQKPGRRRPELARKLNNSRKTLERWLKQLRDQKKVIFKGPAKTANSNSTNGGR